MPVLLEPPPLERLVRCFRQFRKGLRRLVRYPTVPRDGLPAQCLGQLQKHFHQSLVVALGPEKALRCPGMHFRSEHRFALRVPELVGLIQRPFPKLLGLLSGSLGISFGRCQLRRISFRSLLCESCVLLSFFRLFLSLLCQFTCLFRLL